MATNNDHLTIHTWFFVLAKTSLGNTSEPSYLLQGLLSSTKELSQDQSSIERQNVVQVIIKNKKHHALAATIHSGQELYISGEISKTSSNRHVILLHKLRPGNKNTQSIF